VRENLLQRNGHGLLRQLLFEGLPFEAVLPEHGGPPGHP
jgi:hypothetical protein